MPKLLRRDKSPKATDAPPAAETAQLEAEAPAPPPPPAPTASEPPPPPPAPMASEPGNGNGDDYETIMTSGSLLTRMYGEPGERSRSDRDRVAAAEFEQAVAPVMDMLAGSVPEASSPEEAARAWEARIGEVRPDPGAGAYLPGDAFEREARVYYRLLRRDYEKNPRPSLTKNKKVSHHLHSQYKAFPGTRGW